ncbi:hypothetical protein [Streptomyces sp. NPDC005131]
MTTSVRRKVPVLICASCLTTGLLASTGATTAVAASQSPTAVSAAAPAEDGGGGGDDWGGGGGGDWPGGGGGHGGGGDWPGGGGGHDGGGDWPGGGGGHDGGGDGGHRVPGGGDGGHRVPGGGGWPGGGDGGHRVPSWPGARNPNAVDLGNPIGGRNPKPHENASDTGTWRGGASDLYIVCLNEGRVWIPNKDHSGGYCGDKEPPKRKHTQKHHSGGGGLLVKAGLVAEGDAENLFNQLGGCAGSIALGKLKDDFPHIFAGMKAGTFGPKMVEAAKSGDQMELLRVNLVGIFKGVECAIGDSVTKQS